MRNFILSYRVNTINMSMKSETNNNNNNKL